MTKRKLTKEEVQVCEVSIARHNQEMEDAKFKLEGTKFTLGRLDKDIEIQKRKGIKSLKRSIRDYESDIVTNFNTINILKDQIENGVEEVKESDEKDTSSNDVSEEEE